MLQVVDAHIAGMQAEKIADLLDDSTLAGAEFLIGIANREADLDQELGLRAIAFKTRNDVHE